jgi:glycerate 2-kinase
MQDRFEFLRNLFHAAIAAADPETAIKRFLPQKPAGRTVVVGAGKGAAQLAQAFERLWDGPLEGTIVTRYGYGADCEQIEVLEANHPVPDANSLAAGQALLRRVQGLSADDLVVALICGGGSALLASPPPGLTLADEQTLNEILLTSGAPISAMNCIRKHVSAIKGGRLALAAYPARVVTLLVSDIPGDDPAQIASGPTVADHSTRQDALALIHRHGLKLPEAIMTHIENPASQCPSPDDPRLAGHRTHIIASAGLSLAAAAEYARKQGISAYVLSDAMEGEARDIARAHAAIAREIALRDQPFSKPVVLLSGGETTVTMRGNGKGGRNTEFMLSFALAIDGLTTIAALAADTDGIDGSQDNAGATADTDSASRLRDLGYNGHDFLQNNDSWSAFKLLNDLFITGPTGTNVNDFRAILIG